MSHSAHKSAPPETADDRDREDNKAIPPSWHLSNSPMTAPATEDGPPCLKCGHLNTVISPGVGPHHARIDCPKCKSWRWAPKPPPRPERGGAA
jgi:hypothetical protein